MNKTKEGGYFGLISILLAFGIIATWSIYYYTSENREANVPADLQPEISNTGTSTTELERFRADIDASREVQNVVDMHQTSFEFE